MLDATASMPSFDELLGRFAHSHPELAWMTQMIAAQRQAQADTAPEAPADEPLRAQCEALAAQLDAERARSARLQRVARRMAGELDAAQALLSDLAAAFGACGACWGQDAQCMSCRGRGKPGRFAPDPELSQRFCVELPAASRTSTPFGHSTGD
jgi:hypothetical protein